MKKKAAHILLCSICLFACLKVWAEPGILPDTIGGKQPKVGLVLSGGGAKGFAHIGALKVIEQTGLKVDYISGTSMGAIVGALYCMGLTPEQIERIALSQDWAELFDDAASRRYLPMGEKDRLGIYSIDFPVRKGRVDMPSGMVSGQKLQALLAKLAWPAYRMDDFDELPIPFRCVATDLETGQPVILRSGYLPEAVRASMSIPTVFAPVEVGGKVLIDGGVVDNLPAGENAGMGADILLGIDVSAKLRSRDQISSMVDVLDQTVNFQSYATVEEQRKKCRILIVPELAEYTPANFNRVKEIIKRGEEAALRSRPELEKMIDSLGLLRQSERPTSRAVPESIYVTDISVDGLQKVSKQLVLDQLKLLSPVWVTADILDLAVERIYSTQFFEKVSYRLDKIDGNIRLTIRVIEKGQLLLGLGLRYDSNTNAEILAGFSLRNFLGHSSLLAADMRLGDSPQFKLTEHIHAGIGPGLGARIILNTTKYPLYLYQQERRWASLKYNVAGGEIFLGTIYSKSFELGGRVRLEYYRASPDIAPVGYATVKDHLLTAGVSLKIDTQDRNDFPASGQKLNLDYILANRQMGGRADLYKKFFFWQGCFPASGRISLNQTLFWGNVSGKDIPVHYRFYLGGLDQRHGIISLAGLDPMELNGSNVMGAAAGMQYELWPGRFLTAGWNVAKANDGFWKDQFNRQDLVSGVSFGAGILTPAGPIMLELMGGSRHALITYLRLGRNF
jgi:NTE family protein